jgi:AcrR family transcriptional regulator
MGLTAPALYRYYPSRDDLVTGLISEAFEAFALTLEEARDRLPPSDAGGRFRAVCKGYFNWAAANPAAYTLLFGAPVPGYHLGEAAYPSARRGFLALQTTIGEAYTGGQLRPPAKLEALPPALLERYQLLAQYGMPYPPPVTHLALLTWSSIHGFTSLYLYGYAGNFLGPAVEVFVDQLIETLAGEIGFSDSPA